MVRGLRLVAHRDEGRLMSTYRAFRLFRTFCVLYLVAQLYRGLV